jgi:hypothetical protein
LVNDPESQREEKHGSYPVPNPDTNAKPKDATTTGSHTTNTPHGTGAASEERQRPSRNFLARLTVNEWLTFLVGAGSLIVSALTYKNASDTSDLKNAVRNLTNLAQETKRQADNSLGQLTEMRSEQRPWVGLLAIDNIPTDQEYVSKWGFGYKLTIVNTGKSPALNVSFNVRPWKQNVDAPEIPHERCTTDCIENQFVLLPGGQKNIRIPFFQELGPKEGETAWIIARIDYQDTDHNWHKTGICVTSILKPLAEHTRPGVIGTMRSCDVPESNYAD